MIRELGVVNAQQMQDGRVQVVYMHRLIDYFEAEIIGGSINQAALYAAASHPHRESEGVVIAAVLYSVAAHFNYGRAAEFGTADHQSVVKQAARFQIFDHCGERLIRVHRTLPVRLDINVRVPWIAFGIINLHHPHTSFDQSNREQAATRGAARP